MFNLGLVNFIIKSVYNIVTIFGEERVLLDMLISKCFLLDMLGAFYGWCYCTAILSG